MSKLMAIIMGVVAIITAIILLAIPFAIGWFLSAWLIDIFGISACFGLVAVLFVVMIPSIKG